jgi:hypothetical protein
MNIVRGSFGGEIFQNLVTYPWSEALSWYMIKQENKLLPFQETIYNLIIDYRSWYSV